MREGGGGGRSGGRRRILTTDGGVAPDRDSAINEYRDTQLDTCEGIEYNAQQKNDGGGLTRRKR